MRKANMKLCSIITALAIILNIFIPSMVYANEELRNLNEEVALSADYTLDFNSDWSEFDNIYLREDQREVTVEFTRMSAPEGTEMRLNGEVIEPCDGKYIVTLGYGTHTLSYPNFWGYTSEHNIVVKTLPYSIEGKVSPGETITLKLEGLSKQITDGEKHPLKESQTKYKTDIPGLKEIKSELLEGENPDDARLSEITFTIPSDTEPGEYNLTNGKVYHKWGGHSMEVTWQMKKDFSILPEIVLNVDEDGGNEGGGTNPEPSDDTTAPTINTNLEDGKIVDKSRFSFTASASDSEDGNPKLVVKLGKEVIHTDRPGKYNVQLLEDENTITIEASDKSGNIAIKNYKIICNPVLEDGDSITLDSEYLKLEVGEKHQIIAVESPDGRSKESDSTERMTYEVVEGNDVVKVGRYGNIEALKSGKAIINVKYPGLVNPGVIVVNVLEDKESNNPPIITDIKETKYDTFYYTEGNSEYSFKVSSPEADNIEVKVNDSLVNDTNGKYNVNLKEGHNIIHIKSSKGSDINEVYYNIKAKPVTINIINATNEGKEIIQGDTVRVEFEGLETPVPKFLRVYNPKNTRVSYDVNMEGMTNIFGHGTQYDLAKNNAIEFVATKAGTFNFTNGHVDEYWWGDDLFSERDISEEGPNTNAPVKHGKFSKIPGFTVNIGENNNYNDKYIATIKDKDSLKLGEEVVIRIENLEMPGSASDEVWKAETIYNTDIKGLEEIKSEDAKDNASLLKEVRFTLPKDLKVGTYTITNGRVFKEWIGNSILSVEKEFYKSELPEIKLIVKENGNVETNLGNTSNVAPVINAKNIELAVGDKFDVMANISATDNEDGDLTKSIEVVKNTVDTSKVGEYKVVYKVADSQGLEATKEITVIVKEANKPSGDKLKVGVYTDENALYESLEVEYKDGDTAYTVLKRLLGDKVITRGENETLYVEGIDDLYEFDKGEHSGWVYGVNRKMPQVSAGIFDIKPGDEIIWHYTLDLGKDITKSYAKFAKFIEDNEGEITPPPIQPPTQNEAPVIIASDVELKVGDKFDVMANIVATDKEDGDLTKSIKVVENTVDTLKVGIYKVVYEVSDSKNLKSIKEIKVVVVREIEKVDVKSLIKYASDWVLENVKEAGYEDEWKVLGLKRGEIEAPKDYYTNYYNDLVKVLKEKNGQLHRVKYTEYSRVIITLTALGYDPTNVGGYNLVEKLYDLDKVSKQGINGVIFALIALDTKDFEIKGDKNSRDMMINYIIEAQLKDGGFALTGEVGEVDITAMAIQALSNYKDQEKVKSSIDKALAFLSKSQLASGGFGTNEGENLESSAQVLVAINSLGMSAADEMFTKNSKTVVGAMSKFKVEGGGYKHLSSDKDANSMATEQALYSLVSQERLNTGKTSLYDMSDITEDENGNGNGGNGGNGSGSGDGSDGNGSSGSGSGSGSSGNGNNGSGSGNSGSGSTTNQDKETSPQTSDTSILPFITMFIIATIGLRLVNRKKSN